MPVNMGQETLETNADTDIRALVDNIVKLLPHLRDIMTAWITSLDASTTTTTRFAAMKPVLVQSPAILNRYKWLLRTEYGLDLDVVDINALTEQQQQTALQCATNFLGVLLNLAMIAKRAND